MTGLGPIQGRRQWAGMPRLMKSGASIMHYPDFVASTTTTAPSIGQLVLQQFTFHKPITIDRYGVEVTTQAATAVGRYGVYDHNYSTDEPGSLIQEFSALSDFSATGDKLETPASNLLLPAGRYWIGVAMQVASATLRGYRGWPPGGRATYTSDPTVTSALIMSGVTGALPSTFVKAGDGTAVLMHVRGTA